MLVQLVKDRPNGDWEALFINGELVDQNHRLYLRDVLPRLCQAGAFNFEVKYCDFEYAGAAPNKYGDGSWI